MADRTWKLGESCFIVDMSIGSTHAYVSVMPAVVTHIAKHFVQGTSYSARLAGKDYIEGTAFASEQEARDWARAYAERVTAAVSNAKLEGMHPGWNIPDAPRVGDIVYGIDTEAKEVFEAQIGLVRLEYGRLEVGYDDSENNVRIREWWPTKEEALAEAYKRHGGAFVFVPKEEVVRRAKTAEQKIWDDAAQRLRSPEFIQGMKNLAHSLRRDI